MKAKCSLSVLFLFILLTVFSAPSIANDSCDWLLNPLSDKNHAGLSVAEVMASNERITELLREQSQALEQQLKAHPQDAAFDITIVGGGIHGAILSLAARLKYPEARILVLEAGDRVSRVFGNLAGTFDINSKESEGSTENYFPNSPLQMKDITGNEFANSAHMAFLATAAFRASGVPILFENTVRDVTRKQTGSEPYRIRTSSGLKLYSRSVVFATGLGSPSAKLADETLQVLTRVSAQALSENQLTPVMYADHFLRLMAEPEARQKVKDRAGQKTFAVIGSGDGGNITAEMIFGLCRQCLENGEVPREAQVMWVGQKTNNAEEFKQANSERYHRLSGQFGKGIKPIPNYAEDFKVRDDGRVELFLKDQDKPLVVDHVIFASGYKPRYRDLLKNLYGSEPLEDLQLKFESLEYPVFDDRLSPIAARLSVAGKPWPENIFVVGPSFVVDRAADINIPQWVLDASSTKNSVSIDVLGHATASVPEVAFQELDLRDHSQIKLRAGKSTQIFEWRSEASKDPLLLPKPWATYLAYKMELARMLNQYDFEPEQLEVQLRKSTNGTFKIGFKGLNETSAKQLFTSLIVDSAFRRAVEGTLASATKLRTLIPMKHGRIDVEGIETVATKKK